MVDFLLFRRMLSPFVIQLFFWLGAFICIMGGIYGMVYHNFFHGLQILIFGPLIVRIFCEFAILFFKINETLTDLKNALQEKA